ncbi:hypothetical protein FHX74_002882 [Friedmanniella endophytica]|uniref:DUF3866 domain-containing protein n=1 Tax=Microlunatus kandeliicorticis TaxID=1759536 RepID=A0A7W3P6R5_9ACTN|nr:DUF3866 family protein [Microlunatus kandeliicorticis]MBA8795254.1 hypothetical protein [Microlunatus kandeliicorticis]
MIVWADGVVRALGPAWAGAQELTAERDDGSSCRALAYTALVPAPAVGDRVLLNVAALERGLGTGGYALVVAVLDAEGRPTGQPEPPAGHLVKARYLPQQVMLTGADEQGSRWHEALAEADDLAGLPVVLADLHSALPAVLAAIRHDRPGLRVVYLMSDHGALPLAFSRTVARLVEAGWLAGTVTAGQAFGGHLEAVTVHSGLLAARIALGADLVVLSQGPGNLGTGTRWGFSGVAVGEAVNAVGTLGGRPVGALRISGADARPRHRGVSHHSLTAYGRVALLAADLAVPELPGPLAELTDGVETLADRHRLHRVDLDGLDAALRATPVRLSTMGRGLDEDPAYFLGSAAAGRLAVRLLDQPGSPQAPAAGRPTMDPRR